MTKALFVVHSRPSSDEAEGEYNDWYDGTHLSEVVRVPGISQATRDRVRDLRPEGSPAGAHECIAIYEIDGDDDLEPALEVLADARVRGAFHMSDALQMEPAPLTFVYTQVSPAVESTE